jgi:SHS2 domain-containing protein
MQNQFEILSHIADVRVRAWGETPKELFRSAFLGLMKILKAKSEKCKAKKLSKSEISVESSDLNSLLIDFLNEALYQTQVNREIYTDLKFKNFSPKNLKAELLGYPVTEFDEDIKAATYHGAEIIKKNNKLETIVLFDI